MINLVCNKLMEQDVCAAVAERVRRIARYVSANGSAQRLEAWREVCGKVIPLDTRTRWSSTYEMLLVALQLRDAIAVWRRRIPRATDRDELNITDAEWDEVEMLCDLLKPCAEATSRATQDNVGLSWVLPCYNIMYWSLKTKEQSEIWTAFQPAITAAIAVLDQYYGYTSHATSAATILDPRLNFYFFDRYGGYYGLEDTAAAMAFVRKELQSYLDAVPQSAEAEAPVGEDPFAFLTDHEPDIPAGDELARYRQLPRVRSGDDPLLWWKVNEANFPGLAAAAREHLAARATSADSERAFSGGRHLISEFRMSLSPQTIKKCMLVKSWLTVLEG